MVLINAEPSLSDTINSPDLQSPKNRPQCVRLEVRGDIWRAKDLHKSCFHRTSKQIQKK